MTVDLFAARPPALTVVALFRRRLLVALSILASSSLAPNASAQSASEIRAFLSDTVGESDVYPVGDAVDVYRAVLDLLYVDDKDHPRTIVLLDSASSLGTGPCPFSACKTGWAHKSKMDTTVIRAFARQSGKRPRIIDFGYRIPIKRVSQATFEQVAQDGSAQLVGAKPDEMGMPYTFWAGFRHMYPGAWGYVVLSKVSFNPAHTEALIKVFQRCGEECTSNEVIYLRKQGKEWRAIERIAETVIAMEMRGGLRYRGPAVSSGGQSQLLVSDSAGDKPRAEIDDATEVYSAVLDKLYSFDGETPRQIVVTDSRPYGFELSKHRSKIDTSTIAAYNAYAPIRDAMSRFKYRLPITWINDATLTQLEREGVPLIKAAEEDPEVERSPLWLGFHSRFPGALGYASLGRVAFNAAHTQALVFTRHNCGSSCLNAETWFLERKNANWYVVERIVSDLRGNVPMDGLRNLGPDIVQTAYRERRIHGLLIDYETGKPLANTPIQLKRFDLSRVTESDAEGRYALGKLPFGSQEVLVKCPAKLGGKWTRSAPFWVRQGLDSTMNIQADFSLCPQDQ
jgi:hypothetical protein